MPDSKYRHLEESLYRVTNVDWSTSGEVLGSSVKNPINPHNRLVSKMDLQLIVKISAKLCSSGDIMLLFYKGEGRIKIVKLIEIKVRKFPYGLE